MKIKGIKLAKRAFSDKPKKFSITWLLPNFITICALIFGLQAFYHAMLENWNLVIIFIIIAAVFDLLDGRIARFLKSTSNFGMYLDSLSDFVVFGTIPPITIYFWMGGVENKFLWIVVVLFIICSALRLARFNSELSDKPVYAKNYFSGIPTPAAAFLLLLPITGVPIFELNEFKTEFYLSVWMTIIAIGMVSNLPTFSGKVMLVPRKFVIPFLIFLGILSHYIISDPTKGFTLLVIVYILTIPISPFFYYRLRSTFEKNKDKN